MCCGTCSPCDLGGPSHASDPSGEGTAQRAISPQSVTPRSGVKKAFSPHLKRIKRQGFCITHPAWYRHHWAPEGSLRNRCLHAVDRALRFTPLWNLGEYSLYVYERPITD